MRLRSLLIGTLLLTWQLGCGGSRPSGSPGGGPPPPPPQANISISPSSVTAGSPDLTLVIMGSQTFSFTSAAHRINKVVWLANGTETPLSATFVSSSQLSAFLPATLLVDPVTAKLHVEIWDRQGDAPIAISSSVPFQVTSASIPIPSISSISPSTIPAGSGDLTVTINGTNFGHYGHFVWSTAFWTTNGNLHDTGTSLQTTIISSDQLTAVIPATLLQSCSAPLQTRHMGPCLK